MSSGKQIRCECGKDASVVKIKRKKNNLESYFYFCTKCYRLRKGSKIRRCKRLKPLTITREHLESRSLYKLLLEKQYFVPQTFVECFNGQLEVNLKNDDIRVRTFCARGVPNRIVKYEKPLISPDLIGFEGDLDDPTVIVSSLSMALVIRYSWFAAIYRKLNVYVQGRYTKLNDCLKYFGNNLIILTYKKADTPPVDIRKFPLEHISTLCFFDTTEAKYLPLDFNFLRYLIIPPMFKTPNYPVRIIRYPPDPSDYEFSTFKEANPYTSILPYKQRREESLRKDEPFRRLYRQCRRCKISLKIEK